MRYYVVITFYYTEAISFSCGRSRNIFLYPYYVDGAFQLLPRNIPLVTRTARQVGLNWASLMPLMIIHSLPTHKKRKYAWNEILENHGVEGSRGETVELSLLDLRRTGEGCPRETYESRLIWTGLRIRSWVRDTSCANGRYTVCVGLMHLLVVEEAFRGIKLIHPSQAFQFTARKKWTRFPDNVF